MTSLRDNLSKVERPDKNSRKANKKHVTIEELRKFQKWVLFELIFAR